MEETNKKRKKAKTKSWCLGSKKSTLVSLDVSMSATRATDCESGSSGYSRVKEPGSKHTKQDVKITAGCGHVLLGNSRRVFSWSCDCVVVGCTRKVSSWWRHVVQPHVYCRVFPHWPRSYFDSLILSLCGASFCPTDAGNCWKSDWNSKCFIRRLNVKMFVFGGQLHPVCTLSAWSCSKMVLFLSCGKVFSAWHGKIWMATLRVYFQSKNKSASKWVLLHRPPKGFEATRLSTSCTASASSESFQKAQPSLVKKEHLRLFVSLSLRWVHLVVE